MTRPPATSWSPPGSRPAVSPPVLAGGVLAVGGLMLVDPNTTHLPLCPLHAMTGLWCPLCGSLRAGYALLHGRFGVALHDNVLFVFGLPLLVLLWFGWAGIRKPVRIPRPAGWTLLVLLACFTVLRNLPVGSWLAPPG